MYVINYDFFSCEDDNSPLKNLDIFLTAVLTSTHNPYVFEQKQEKLFTLVNPNFTVSKWGLKGSHLQGRVILMYNHEKKT